MQLDRVAILGAGAWGTALAQAAAIAGREVTLVGRDPMVIAEINELRVNSAHLPGVTLLDTISASTSLPDADLVVLAVPAQATRFAVAALDGRLDGKPVVLTAKGLEHGTLARQSQVLAEAAPGAIPYVLSGPSFAADVASGRPTAVTLAGDHPDRTSAVAAALAGPTFRLYAADDRLGVELAGALKNVYAIGCGAVDGAGLGASARSALLARAFAELTRLVVRMGGGASTLTGLAGLGDLTLSCTSTQSRNYRYGVSLGRGESPGSDLAEGALTAPVARQLANQVRIDAPLIDAVNLLIDGNTSIADIVAGLMSRPLKREED
ncbi:NAD(P)-dependent glycerol-3-phosphate dehydrogenase [Devosia sp. ZB163]|uniref:NAD(P)H-dependent glycerol-3-phosphate dehydrogenase n=1 Tax=Devosia sp. ZB163 TaxID=3025938 RepID=UPI0023616E27|nr:NAD(P)H-dependent glycerol-3-phosphate dehydrogenase [Devosia sp. ZB163]MDC9822225.1 NAD(P)-dependent glycerol-3-phosphate dehydrogenase [Devosia sp. ZB163]